MTNQQFLNSFFVAFKEVLNTDPSEATIFSMDSKLIMKTLLDKLQKRMTKAERDSLKKFVTRCTSYDMPPLVIALSCYAAYDSGTFSEDFAELSTEIKTLIEECIEINKGVILKQESALKCMQFGNFKTKRPAPCCSVRVTETNCNGRHETFLSDFSAPVGKVVALDMALVEEALDYKRRGKLDEWQKKYPAEVCDIVMDFVSMFNIVGEPTKQGKIVTAPKGRHNKRGKDGRFTKRR